MLSYGKIEVSFLMRDGRKLRCEYTYSEMTGTHDDPQEFCPDEPTYFIEDDEVLPGELPKGLGTVAQAMAFEPWFDKRFKTKDLPLDETDVDFA